MSTSCNSSSSSSSMGEYEDDAVKRPLPVNAEVATTTTTTTTTTTDASYAKCIVEMRSIQLYSSKDEYIYAMKEDLAAWINSMYATDVSASTFSERMENGVLICKHADNVMRAASRLTRFSVDELRLAGCCCQVKPSTTTSTTSNTDTFVMYRANARALSFQARDNIANFIEWCRHIVKVRECLMFETDDLILRKNEKNFILCLLEVARFGSRYGISVPTIIQLEQEIEAELAYEREQMMLNKKKAEQVANHQQDQTVNTPQSIIKEEEEEEEQEEKAPQQVESIDGCSMHDSLDEFLSYEQDENKTPPPLLLLLPQMISSSFVTDEKQHDATKRPEEETKMSSASSVSSISSSSSSCANQNDQNTNVAQPPIDNREQEEEQKQQPLDSESGSCSPSQSFVSQSSSSWSSSTSTTTTTNNSPSFNADATSATLESTPPDNRTPPHQQQQQNSAFEANTGRPAASVKRKPSLIPQRITSSYHQRHESSAPISMIGAVEQQPPLDDDESATLPAEEVQEEQQQQEQEQVVNQMLHTHVCSMASKCTCEKKFLVDKIGEGKYRIGATKNIVFIRVSLVLPFLLSSVSFAYKLFYEKKTKKKHSIDRFSAIT